MASCSKRRGPVARGVRRLARKRLDKAIESLRHCDQAEAVHAVRKDIKQIRSLFRLVGGRLRKKDYRRQLKLLRRSAHQLAPVRDGYIKTKALRDLAAHFKDQVRPTAFRRV